MNEYWQTVPSDTLFDFEEFYLRMAQEIPNGCTIAEIGLANGRSVLYLAACLQALGKQYRIVGIDSMAYGGQDQRNELIQHIQRSTLPDIELLEMSSLDAACKFADQTFDLVFIDSSHMYEFTKAEMQLWMTKVKHGGILAGHDAITCDGVARAIEESTIPEPITIEDTRLGYGVWWMRRSEEPERKIALVVTAYNEHKREGRLARCVEVAMHDPRICELVIRDDSGDGTPGAAYFGQVVGQIVRRSPDSLRVIVARNGRNLGVFGNKLAAIRTATCEWMQSIDSDNHIDSAYIDTLYELSWRPRTAVSASFAAPRFDYREQSGRRISLETIGGFLKWIHAFSLLNTGNQFFHRTTMLRLFDGFPAEDFQTHQPDYFGVGSRGDRRWRVIYDSADSFFFNRQWLLAGNDIFVAPGLTYQHEVHAGSSWEAAPPEKHRLPHFYAQDLIDAANKRTGQCAA